jgi:hypothetical protein
MWRLASAWRNSEMSETPLNSSVPRPPSTLTIQPISSGSAKKTEEGRKSAINQLNAFQELQGLGAWDNLDEKFICDENYWQCFGTFLVNIAVDKKGDLLARDTALQYLSGCKETVKKKYPNNALWQREKEWYNALRKNVEKSIMRRNNMVGAPHQEKAARIGRALLLKITQHYYRRGDVDSFKRCFVLLITWLAIGRAGECAKSTWNNVRWDYDLRCLSLLWIEQKTGSQYEMLFFSDKNSCEMDVFHGLACFLMVGGSSNEYIFPELSNLQQPSGTITKYLQKLFVEKVLPSDEYSGTSLRIGSVNELMSHGKITLVEAILRGGWEFESIVKIFTYLMQLVTANARTGRALSGWTNVDRGAYAPELDLSSVDENKRVSVKNMIADLFSTSYVPRLEPLFNSLFASLLMHFDYMCREYGIQHLIPSQIIAVAATFNITYNDLILWGKGVRESWTKANFDQQFQKESKELTEEWICRLFRQQQDQINSLVHENLQQKSMISEILNLVRNQSVQASNPRFSPTKPATKRARSRSPENISFDESESLLCPDVSNSSLSVSAVSESDHCSLPLSEPANDLLPSGKKNALQMLGRTATGAGYTVPEIRGFKITTLFKDFVIWDLDKKANLQVGNRSIRNRMLNCFAYMKRLLSNEEKSCISSFPAKTSPKYAESVSKLSVLANDVAKRTMKSLLEDEEALGLTLQKKAQDGVSGVGDRVAKIFFAEEARKN